MGSLVGGGFYQANSNISMVAVYQALFFTSTDLPHVIHHATRYMAAQPYLPLPQVRCQFLKTTALSGLSTLPTTTAFDPLLLLLVRSHALIPISTYCHPKQKVVTPTALAQSTQRESLLKSGWKGGWTSPSALPQLTAPKSEGQTSKRVAQGTTVSQGKFALPVNYTTVWEIVAKH